MVEFTKSFVSGFRYNEMTPQVSWGIQFSNYAGLRNHESPDVREFDAKLRGTVLRQKAIELVKNHTVPD